jgi:pimeloyl-ACP methyl ester carboxylesterase
MNPLSASSYPVRGARRFRWRPRIVGAAVLSTVLALVGSACSGGVKPSPETPATTASATMAPATGIAWTSCGTVDSPTLECAKLAVPLDWGEPTGEQIELAVIRHPASRPDQRIGSIFLNPGGPGDTGVGLVRGAANELDGWGAGRFDLVSWDPRGTHASSPVHCFANDAEEAAFWKDAILPSTKAESVAYQKRMVDLAQRCGQVMGKLLSHISTTDTVRDLDAIRAAVGEETMTYVGLSYGTMIGQTYANMFPQRVRAMMLDAVVDAVPYTADAESRAVNNASSTDEVFDQFAKLCDAAGPKRCALAGHPGQTAAQRVDWLLEQTRKAPIPAPNADPPGELSYSDLTVTSFAALRDPFLWPEWAKQLNAAADGDASELEIAARPGRTPKAFAEATKSAAISCLDGPAKVPSTDWPTVIGDLDKVSVWAGAIQGWWLWAPCASNWPAKSDDRYAGPWNAKTANPLLVIGSRYDPNTSYQNAVRVAQRLGNAVLLTHDGYGHVSSHDPSECIEKARVAYLVDLVTPPPGTVCAADQKPFP